MTEKTEDDQPPVVFPLGEAFDDSKLQTDEERAAIRKAFETGAIYAGSIAPDSVIIVG